jgi:hypothetical protein
VREAWLLISGRCVIAEVLVNRGYVRDALPNGIKLATAAGPVQQREVRGEQWAGGALVVTEENEREARAACWRP